MQSPPKHPLIAVTQEEMERVRQYLNIDRVKIITNLDVIMGWIQKEGHLAEASKYLDINCLERLHIIEKGSVERTKSRIDRLLTTRGMVPEICMDKTIDEFDEFSKHVIYLPLPKLNPADLTRVTVIQLVSEKGNDTILLNFLRYVFLVIDYCMWNEYNLGERYILDLKHFNMTGLAKMNPFTLKKGEVVCTDGYGLRIKGIHIVNAPSFVNKLITLLKTTLSEKLFKRIHVHNTLDDLRKEIAKEILPEEYGGDLDSASILYVAEFPLSEASVEVAMWCIYVSDSAASTEECAFASVEENGRLLLGLLNQERSFRLLINLYPMSPNGVLINSILNTWDCLDPSTDW